MSAAPALEGVSARAVASLAQHGTLRHYRRGSYLFHQGDDSADVFFLHEGRVELSSISSDGYRGLHTAIEPPQFFGELAALSDLPRSTSAIALEESSVWSVDGGAFLTFLTDHPDAAVGLMRALARQLLAHESLVDDLLFLDLKGRVAKRLLGLVSPRLDEVPTDGATLPSIVTQADLASLAGGSRENVSRILSDFQRRGIIGRNGKRYVLKDVKSLRRFARL